MDQGCRRGCHADCQTASVERGQQVPSQQPACRKQVQHTDGDDRSQHTCAGNGRAGGHHAIDDEHDGDQDSHIEQHDNDAGATNRANRARQQGDSCSADTKRAQQLCERHLRRPSPANSAAREESDQHNRADAQDHDLADNCQPRDGTTGHNRTAYATEQHSQGRHTEDKPQCQLRGHNRHDNHRAVPHASTAAGQAHRVRAIAPIAGKQKRNECGQRNNPCQVDHNRHEACSWVARNLAEQAARGPAECGSRGGKDHVGPGIIGVDIHRRDASTLAARPCLDVLPADGSTEVTPGPPLGCNDLCALLVQGSEVLEASMLVIGDELLAGYVTDVNSPLLAQRLRAHGIPLSRVHVVADDMDAIDEELSVELGRARPRIVVTSGGIGSTPDDITFEAVAASLGRDLIQHPELTRRIDTLVARTRADGFDADEVYVDHMLRMARVPHGSRLLSTDRYWVPAIALDVDGGADAEGATVVILPGVPRIFSNLLADVVEPQMLAGRNDVPHVEEITHWFPESALNAVFAMLIERHPQVKLGSYPATPMLVRLTGPHDDVRAAARMVRDELDRLGSTPGGAKLSQAWRDRAIARNNE